MESNSDNICSKRVKAGKRTYFIDLKPVNNGDGCYMTISESRKMIDDRGQVISKKSKLFIYPEDLNRIEESFCEVAEQMRAYTKRIDPDYDFDKFSKRDHERDIYNKDY